MDLADNDPTLFQTWLGAGNTSNTIEKADNKQWRRINMEVHSAIH